MRKVNCITINTDASFSPQYKIGAYAFYIVCDYFKIWKSGVFRTPPKNPDEAELMCMANALHTLAVQPDLPKSSLIVINSDALNTFGKIKRKGNHKIGRFVAKKLREARLKTRIGKDKIPKFDFRHVKAHSKSTAPRSLANKWCDVEARKQLRLEISKIKTCKEKIYCHN